MGSSFGCMYLRIFFIFHQNNNAHTKAKVKPPRLNGGKVGVFSTRSPYRPNNIGLTLARIENIQGATLTVSGLDIIDGTPVVDLKPYIPQYDSLAYRGQLYPDQSPCPVLDSSGDNAAISDSGINSVSPGSLCCKTVGHTLDDRLGESNADMCEDGGEVAKGDQATCQDFGNTEVELSKNTCTSDLSLDTNIGKEAATCEFGRAEKKLNDVVDICVENLTDEIVTDAITKKAELNVDIANHGNDVENRSKLKHSEIVSNDVHSHAAADWIDKPPVSTLHVRFTPTAEEQLSGFSPTSADDRFKLLHLKSSMEARAAIVSILQEDPRSTYRRKHCVDSLYYFTVDVVHVTCWFDEGLVEVVRIKPACLVQQCKQVFTHLVR